MTRVVQLVLVAMAAYAALQMALVLLGGTVGLFWEGTREGAGLGAVTGLLASLGIAAVGVVITAIWVAMTRFF